jgi:hypothetical protein
MQAHVALWGFYFVKGKHMERPNKDENAKDPKWKDPAKLPGVTPDKYDKTIDSGSGSAKK